MGYEILIFDASAICGRLLTLFALIPHSEVGAAQNESSLQRSPLFFLEAKKLKNIFSHTRLDKKKPHFYIFLLFSFSSLLRRLFCVWNLPDFGHNFTA